MPIVGFLRPARLERRRGGVGTWWAKGVAVRPAAPITSAFQAAVRSVRVPKTLVGLPDGSALAAFDFYGVFNGHLDAVAEHAADLLLRVRLGEAA
eukprot:15440759-Alexandrium_andersonii.AAC.1